MKTTKQLHLMAWRWHFYAGLLILPVAVLLGVTGSIYLFKPHVEPWLYRDLWFTQAQTKDRRTLSLREQIQTASTAVKDGEARSVTLHQDPRRTTEVWFRRPNRETVIVYVDRATGQVAGKISRDQMLMRRVRRLHGELMIGDWGSALVEITACWTLILVMTGMYLSWPKGKHGWRNLLWPRLRWGRRLMFRDLHAVTAFYTSGLIVVLVITGLPWSNVWGGAFKKLQAASQAAPPLAARRRVLISSPSPPTDHPITVDQVAARADEFQVPFPRTIHLPQGPSGSFGITGSPPDLKRMSNVYLDQYNGEVIARATWQDYPWLAKAVSTGIQIHQGQWCGMANLVLMLVAALAFVWIAVTGAVMWWIRRPMGKLGVPPMPIGWRVPKIIAAVAIVLGILFPLSGVSYAAVLIVDWAILRRFEWARRFFG